MKKKLDSLKIKVGKVEREALVRIPQGGSDKLLISFHGAGQDAGGMAHLTRFADLCDDVVLVFPESVKKTSNSWNIPNSATEASKQNVDDIGFVRELISRDWGEDKIAKVGLVGFSLGGFLAEQIPISGPSVDFIATVAATAGKDQLKTVTFASKPRVLIFLGTEDPQLKWDGGTIKFGAPYETAGAEEVAKFWCVRHNLPWEPTITKIDKKPSDKLWVEKIDNGQVTLFKCCGYGHVYPGSSKTSLINIIQPGKSGNDVNASELILNTFRLE